MRSFVNLKLLDLDIEYTGTFKFEVKCLIPSSISAIPPRDIGEELISPAVGLHKMKIKLDPKIYNSKVLTSELF